MPSKISDKLLQIDPSGRWPLSKDATTIIRNYIHMPINLYNFSWWESVDSFKDYAATIIAFLATLTKKELILMFSTQETNKRFNNSPSRCLGSGNPSSGN